MSATPNMLSGDSNLAHQTAGTPQLNRSCESCRALKVRCLPDASTPNQCQRCSKANRPCVFVAPQRRRPRKRTDSRVAQLEKEMRQMRSLLKDRLRVDESSAESAGSEREDSREPELAVEPHEVISTIPEDPSSSADSVRKMDFSPSFPSTSPYPNTYDSGPANAPIANATPAPYSFDAFPREDVIDRGVLSLEYANELVAFYVTELTAFAPIVVLPPHTTATQLRQSAPVLFLSVIAAASVSLDAQLAAVLNQEIIRVYAERFFINGDKSLELVQALLIMIVFYHPPDSPLKLQFYQYTHIAATMALEIGLASKRRVNKTNDRGVSKRTTYDEQMAEQARTILYCYHLTSVVAMKTRRPNLLLFNEWMAECIKHLEQSPNVIDRHMATWFDLQRIVDETMASFGLDDTSSTAPVTESRLQAILRWFDNRMLAWRKELPIDMLTVPMTFEYHYANLAVYEMAVGEGYRDPDAIKQQYYTLPSPEGKAKSASTQLSAVRVDITIKWMNAAHEMLDFFLSCDTDMLRKVPNLVYTRVGTAMMSLLKIYFSVSAGALGEFITSETVNVDKYLVAMTQRLAEASGGQKYKIPSRWYYVVAVKARNWYDRLQHQQLQTAVGLGTAVTAGASMSHPSVASQKQPSFDPTHQPVPFGNYVPIAPFHPIAGGYGVPTPVSDPMWSPDQGGFRNAANASQFASYQAPNPMMSPHYVYDMQHQQRTPSNSSLQGNPSPPKTGMELDDWLPDGSVFALPTLPGF
ncbi:C6 zinc finger domain protein [Aspergillus saccharolyticus JOP 1030-1]|uniref:C6 zinc finger domain protein n=1 Tax=Aspergillus saccharolyticus JOP 1030-1 TaxID=1450539 RepID=A0A318Z7I4_9EURO|nr:C6 zinc finger domain protein [Aspergillus saccharolyticus JOP 1030-1]PYH43295.1 C6 zinc finger domain protein [Aspergillus saccharolyticus JOP 1030-1]